MTMRTVEDVALLSTNLKVLKFLSFLIEHNWRRYVVLTSFVVVNISQFADLYYSKESIEGYVKNTYVAALFFNCFVRSLLLCAYSRRYGELMDILKELYFELADSKVPKLRKMVTEITHSARTWDKINWSLAMSAILAYFLYPIFANKRVLPYGMYIPVIDKYQSPYYEILYVLHVIIGPLAAAMFIPFTNLIVAFIIFGILMCRVLQYELRQLHQLPIEAVRPKLITCISYHQKLTSYVDMINGLNTYLFLLEFLTFGAMMCAMLFSILVVETTIQVVSICIYITTLFSQNVVSYYYANELYDQSLGIALAAYDVNWYEFDIPTQKILKSFIQRAQKPCSILVGNLYPMNLQLLQSFLNTTYSYFALLRHFYGRT